MALQQVRITSEGRGPWDVKVTNAENGEEIYASRIEIGIDPNSNQYAAKLTIPLPIVDATIPAEITRDIIGSAPMPARRFILVRSVDITGISGTGVILYGVEWTAGGPVDVYWLGTKTTGQYPSMEVVRATHCYNNNARVVYIDGEAEQEASAASEGMTFRKFAKTWLEQSGLLDASADYDGWLGQCILDIVVFIAGQGHSGQSVAAAISALNSIYDAYDNGESPIWKAYWESDEGKRIKAAFASNAPDTAQ